MALIDLPGRTEATLEPVMRDERGLDGMELIAMRHTLDGKDVGAVMAEGQGKAGIHPAPIDQHGAGATLAAITALFSAREIQPLAQEVEERHTGNHRGGCRVGRH